MTLQKAALLVAVAGVVAIIGALVYQPLNPTEIFTFNVLIDKMRAWFSR